MNEWMNKKEGKAHSNCRISIDKCKRNDRVRKFHFTTITEIIQAIIRKRCYNYWVIL